MNTEPVVRGFIPDGWRSRPKTCNRGLSIEPGAMVLRLLRSRSGINPLATCYESYSEQVGYAIKCRWLSQSPAGNSSGLASS